MTSPTFVAIADKKMALLIERANRRVVVAAPAIRDRTADAIVAIVDQIGADNLDVVLDCDEEVFRLGYGNLQAVERLRAAGINVRQASGLRVGLLIVDDRAWVYSPTALYVEAEVHSDETPNAVTLSAAEVEHLLPSVVANYEGEVAVEIGCEAVSDAKVSEVAESLENAPPIAFDVARQVRVFEPYIQYVEVSLKGCAIQRRRLEVPNSIQGLDPNADLSSRLHTRFDLIEKSSDVSSKSLERELEEIRKNFTRALGKPWGRVLLRSARKMFDARIEQFREKLAAHKQKVKQELSDVLGESRQKLIEHFLPLVKASPPDVFMGRLATEKPSDDQFRAILGAELDRKFPGAEELLTDMQLEVQFRDVTYETLNEDGFAESLREAYPHVDWDKPFDEFDAAKARDDGE